MPLFSDKYDLILVGGGPAGSIAAETAAGGGLKTLVLEKDRDIGIPVRCAEAVAAKHLPQYIKIDHKFIDNWVHKFLLVSPGGIGVHISIKEDGAILNRKVFDLELAKQAARAGAQVITRANVTGMERKDGLSTIKFQHYGKEYFVRAPLIIGADGVESRVGRWAGLNTNLPLTDIETCFQYLLYHPDIVNDRLDFYFGEEAAPGGYLWVFPKGDNCANVGLGISGNKASGQSVKEYLDKFVQKKFPGASILSSVAGSVPAHRVPKKITCDGIMLVGDAAHQDNPLSGGGILNALAAGRFAGQTAIKAFDLGDFSNRTLENYAKAWKKELGMEHNVLYNLKRIIQKFSDDDLDGIAEKLVQLPDDQRTLQKMFITAFAKQPAVVIDVIMNYLKE